MSTTKNKSRKQPNNKSLTRLLSRTNRFNVVAAALVVLGVAALGLVHQSLFATTPTVFTPSQWASSLNSKIHSDTTQSVVLANKKILWIFGDTNMINGKPTYSPAFGFPHDAFVLQDPNTLHFMALPGKYGYGWQQIPNWSDGTVFWMTTPVVDGNTLYIFGVRVNESASGFTVLGTYMAEFDASTLTYESVMPVPAGATNGTVWGSSTKLKDGWVLSGTHNVPCYITDCKVGDFAYIPFGQLANPHSWTLYNNRIPASDDLGTTLGLVRAGTGWDIFTKQGDSYGGSSIERLSAASLFGDWSVTATWPITAPQGAYTYGVATHIEQAASSGQVLVSYDVNGANSSVYPYAVFKYYRLETAGPIKLVADQNECVDDYHSLTISGNKVNIWACNGTKAQLWTYSPLVSKTVGLLGMCLATKDASTKVGTPVVLAQCNGTADQQWQGGLTGSLMNVAARKCLATVSAAVTSGSALVIANCAQTSMQGWTLP